MKSRTSSVILLLAVFLAACSRPRPITVASKDGEESNLLGEIVAQHLEQGSKWRVKRMLGLGATQMVHRALINGQVDLYPEYTGTAMLSILQVVQENDVALARARLLREYQRRFHLLWMPLEGLDASYTMVIREEEAARRNVRTLTQAEHSEAGWALGEPADFLQLPDGSRALLRAYSLPLSVPAKVLPNRQLYPALQSGQVNMIAGRATDGFLLQPGFATLSDDRHLLPSQEVAIVVREDTVTAHPGLQEALSRLSGKLTQGVMRQLNYEVQGKHRSPRDVAAGFLRSVGL